MSSWNDYAKTMAKTGLSLCATSSTTRQTAQRERNHGTRTRAELKQCCAGNIMAPDPAARRAIFQKFLLAQSWEYVFKAFLAWGQRFAVDLQPNIHIDDVHYAALEVILKHADASFFGCFSQRRRAGISYESVSPRWTRVW